MKSQIVENWYTGYTDLIPSGVPLWIPIVPPNLLPDNEEAERSRE